jgi:hypothetical protein
MLHATCQQVEASFFAQNITDAAHGMDQTRFAVRLEFLAQIADVHFDDVALTAEVVAPYAVVDDIASEDLLRMAHEQFEQIVLFGSEIDPSVANGNLVRSQIHRQGTVAQHGCGVFALTATELNTNTRQQFFKSERFDQVVICTGFEASNPIWNSVTCRQHNDRHIRRGAQPPCNFQPIDARQHQIKHHQIRRLFTGYVERLASIACDLDRVPFKCQPAPEISRNLGFIFND